MKLQTPVEIVQLKARITYQSRIAFLGSCFADSMGSAMQSLGFDVLLNPFGTLYNPASIAWSVERLLSGVHFNAHDVICSQGRYTTFHHHSRFSKGNADTFIEGANASLDAAVAAFAQCDTCIVTLGTSWVFHHKERGIIVSNCHKVPAAEFERKRLSIEQTVELLEHCVTLRPDIHWIFTVSPIRHFKDGAHGNNISKASLLLAIDELCSCHSNVEYFPAYEIMMDELRDYRFYDEDMVHPSQQAVNHIFEQFVRSAVEPSEYEKMRLANKAFLASNHRPISD